MLVNPRGRDPFRRTGPTSRDRFTRTLSQIRSGSAESYEGQHGLEYLMAKAMPHLLVRTDMRRICPCQSYTGRTGDVQCTRCFGTGHVVVSLDRCGMYISRSSPITRVSANAVGWDMSDSKLIYCGRWVSPQIGDLVLEVGWNCPNEEVYTRGQVRSVDNVYLIKQSNHIGLAEVDYIENFTIFSNARKPFIEDFLLFADADQLPPYVNRLAP